MNPIRHVLAFTAVIEAATGLALIGAPGLVVRLLLGSETAGAGVPLGRVAGCALLSLGIACLPARGNAAAGPSAAALRAMLAYNALIALYLLYLGIRGWSGPLLWPAVVLHAVVAMLLARQLGMRPGQAPRDPGGP